MTMPFGIACAALLRGQLGDALAAAAAQVDADAVDASSSVGIMLGGWWAYEVLGWGGYWAWDPVENASFLPWLTATAFTALGDGARSEGHAEAAGPSRSSLATLRPHHPRHVHDALGRLQLGALLHAVRHRPHLPGVPRRLVLVVSACCCSRCASTRWRPRAAATRASREAVVPGQQPALRACSRSRSSSARCSRW